MKYKKFFFLVAEATTTSVQRFLPSSIVDLVWQRHMLDTANYFDDCERFDMPGHYCHRHELFTVANSTGNRNPSDLHSDDDAQKHYSFTLKAYEQFYGSAPREDIWPRVYGFVSFHEKRKVKLGSDADGVEGKYVSFAMPHALLPLPSVNYDQQQYSLPAEELLMENLMWVGELVFDTLPLKQLRCKQGEVIGQISFEAERKTAVAKVVREYARFLQLIMRQYASLNAEESSKFELTPSKLVDELWHAHILSSPAYFKFCEEFAPFCRYVHHSPHFDKPHNYHQPGFEGTLKAYREVFKMDPVGSVWGVLGESGGGDSAHWYQPVPPPPHFTPRDFSKEGAGIGCGAGIQRGACGVGNVDPSDNRMRSSPSYFSKPRLSVENSARCKVICDIAIIPKCINSFQLQDVPVSEYIIRAPYERTYRKNYVFKDPSIKPILFMTPGFVSEELFWAWQAKIESVLEFHYKAAQIVSTLTAGPVKDMYWRSWKTNVLAALDALKAEIHNSLVTVALKCCVVHSSMRQGATIYIEAFHEGRKWTPITAGIPIKLPAVVPRCTGPVVWPPTEMSPASADRLQQLVLDGEPTSISAAKPPKLATLTPSDRCVAVSTLMFCDMMEDWNDWVSIPEVNSAHEISNFVVNHLEYITSCSSDAMGRMFGDEIQDIPFMTADVISPAVFGHIQQMIESVALTRYRIAICIVSLLKRQQVLKAIMKELWTSATDRIFTGLAEKISRSLNHVDLQLCFESSEMVFKELNGQPRYSGAKLPTRSFTIRTINNKKWTNFHRLWDFPMEPVDMFAFAPVCNELMLLSPTVGQVAQVPVVPRSAAANQVVVNMPLVGHNVAPLPVEYEPQFMARETSSISVPANAASFPVVRELMALASHLAPQIPVPPSGSVLIPQMVPSSGLVAQMPPMPLVSAFVPQVAPSAQGPLVAVGVPLPGQPLESAPQFASVRETISVVVPANYPMGGEVIAVTSPTTGQVRHVNIPRGSLPGTQFLVHF